MVSIDGPEYPNGSSPDDDVVVDVAGAFIGGAARFLREMKEWKGVGTSRGKRVRLIGEGRSLTPQWLLIREWVGRGATLNVALNNASFVGGDGKRVVLLRNALHFCDSQEMGSLGFSPSRSLILQTPVVRRLAQRADVLVVPCTDMAERVARYIPSLESRIVVRGHPVSPPSWRGRKQDPENFILTPIIPAPYKNLDDHVCNIVDAMRHTGLRLKITATPDQLPRASKLGAVDCLGVLPSRDLDRVWEKARAIYYPTALESFGYPLAEARVGGRWVIARDTRQNREIAGKALVPFDSKNLVTLESAVQAVQQRDPQPDLDANDPMKYFEWLLGRH